MSYYVTTSIAYSNAPPHIGFAMEMVIADVLARAARKQDVPVVFSTGTDEHGTKIVEKAEEAGVEPRAFVDQVSQRFRDLQKQLNISNDRFIRTTDQTHEQRAQVIWQNLQPHIYKGSYEGWYCVGCESYVTETTAKENNGVCPQHNREYEKLKEDNYYFKLSVFSDQIEEFIRTDQLSVMPASRKHEILGIIGEGLSDISVSRPKEKISWGVPVPGDDTQIMYVWFEALMNYITVLGYPEHQDFTNFWPANVHVIGKDILRFHAAVWPGMLLALGLPLPHVVYAHGFITVDGKKMSKSLGNVVSPQEIVDKYGTDAFRYFFLRHIPSHGDGDFSWHKLEAAYNNELANELGNAVSRTVALITKYQQTILGDIPPQQHDTGQYWQAIKECRFDRALDEVWDQVRGLNQYIEETKPWQIAKEGDTGHLREVLAYQASCLVQIADMLEPFMPETATKIKAIFGDGIVTPLEGTLFPKEDSTRS